MAKRHNRNKDMVLRAFILAPETAQVLDRLQATYQIRLGRKLTWDETFRHLLLMDGDQKPPATC